MSSGLSPVILPLVYVRAMVNPMAYDAFAKYLLGILWEELREQCSLLIDRRNPMLLAYLERFAAEEGYASEYVDDDNFAIIGNADLYILLTKATDIDSHHDLRTLRANGVRTVVIIQ